MLIKKFSKILPVLALAILLLTGCSNGKMDNSELDSIMSNGNYIIVDVRTKEEYEEEHIKDAINIPLDEIDDSISLDKSKKILVYCRSGNRSEKAFASLLNMGYDVYNLGGINDIDLPKE
ncbi:MAG: rhodanese-like domain-containing protein [Bacilli bacterium]|nr:rhodanese-like domain-containing protein [Bacilli bacterium]